MSGGRNRAMNFSMAGFWAIAGLWLLAVAGSTGMAQEMAQPEVENSKYQFAGEITGNDVYVRSGPGEGYYPTMKLNKGAHVTVVGIKFGWLKILPPEGSFSYIPKAWVERSGDGTVGRVTKADSPVRAGSALNELKSAVQTGLNENDRVVILGEKDEYFKIQPPAGAYLYVFKDYVAPVKQVAVADDGTSQDVSGNGAMSVPGTTEAGTNERSSEHAGGEGSSANGVTDATGTDTSHAGPGATTRADGATTQPADATAQAEAAFSALETQFREASDQPIDQQPVEQMLSGYEPLATGSALPESMRRIAAYRVAILKERAKAKQELLALKKEQEEFTQRQQASTAEREELAERIAERDVKIYAAVGELRPSSLQHGKEMLFRLTDPANGRTVVYIRSNDPAYGNLMGQFVGVKGTVSEDAALNIQVIAPTAVEKVDPSEVNGKVAARIVPPSMSGQGSGN